jgi:hypothetical protein
MFLFLLCIFYVAIVFILALQLLHSQFCNLYTFFCNHTFSTFFCNHSHSNLQSYVVKSSCNCFLTGIATLTLPVLQFVHFFAITHSALFYDCNHSHRPICNHMLSNLVAIVSYWHCNCYTCSFAICTLFFAITHSAVFFATTHTDQFHMLSNPVAMHRSCNHS